VDEVNTKVTNLSRSVEETQERVKKNEQRIGEVDKKADAAGQRAEAANRSAADAKTEATTAAVKADAVDAASRKLVFEVTLTEDKAKFALGKAELTDEAKAEIDALVSTLAAQPKNMYLEIEGHTDATGSEAYNKGLGLERAEAVKMYLYEAHNIPLHKIECGELRRNQAGGAQRHEGRPRAEPAGRDQGPQLSAPGRSGSAASVAGAGSGPTRAGTRRGCRRLTRAS